MKTVVYNKLFKNQYRYKLTVVNRNSAVMPWKKYYQEITNLLSKSDKNAELNKRSIAVYIHTNDRELIDQIIALDSRNVYMLGIADSIIDSPNTIYLPNIPFDIKVTLGSSPTSQVKFVEWASKNKNFRLTQNCIRELKRPISWGGTYFYVSGEKNLFFAQMFLGKCIRRIDKIIHKNVVETDIANSKT